MNLLKTNHKTHHPDACKKDQNAMVVGLAETGLAVGRLLCEDGYGVHFSDIRPIDALKSAGVREAKRFARQIHTGGHDFSNFASMDLVVLSPGVPQNIPVVQRCIEAGISVVSEIEYAFPHIRGKIIGVSGAKGKTTVVRMLENLFRASGVDFDMGGHIEKPLSSVNKTSAYILAELACYQMERIESFHPHIYLLTGIEHDHQDRYPIFEEYFHLKTLLLLKQKETGFAVLPESLRRWADAQPIRASMIYYGKSPQKGVQIWHDSTANRIQTSGLYERGFDLNRFQLMGRGNVLNLMAAVGAARIMDIPWQNVQDVIDDFKPLEHRAQVIYKDAERIYIDDSCSNHVLAIKMIAESEDVPLAVLTCLDAGELAGIENICRAYEIDPKDPAKAIAAALKDLKNVGAPCRVLYSPAVAQGPETGLDQKRHIFRTMIARHASQPPGNGQDK